MPGELVLITILVSFIIASIVTIAVYYKKGKEQSKPIFYLLSTLRFLGVFLICLLFINPIVKSHTSTTYKGKVIIAFDNSESVSYAMRLKSFDMQQIIDSIKYGLDDRYDVEILGFGQDINKEALFSGKEIKSDYNKLINSVVSEYLGQDVEALVLIGDGIYTTGSNPVYHNYQTTFPIYTIGVGDTSGVRDAYVGEIRHNRTTYLGNSFPVRINIEASLCRANTLNIRVLSEDGQEVFSDRLTPTNDRYAGTLDFSLSTERTGIQKYTVVIDSVRGESNLSNNKSEFSIDVVNEKRKILAVSAGPSPDLGMLKRALDSQKSYEFDYWETSAGVSDISNYDLVIIHSWAQEGRAISSLVEKAVKAKVSQLFFIDAQDDVLPLQNFGLNFSQISKMSEQIEARYTSSFSAFKLDEKIQNFIDNSPPVVGSLSIFDASDDEWHTLATRKIKGVDTDYPLITMRSANGYKQSLFLAEGFWKWRMNAYKEFETHDDFDAFIQNLVNFLIVDKNKDNFNLSYSHTYEQGEKIRFTGELYDDNFDVIDDKDIEMKLTDSAGNVFDYLFDKVNGRYYLYLGSLPVGKFWFDAKVDIGGESVHEKGSFDVVKVDVETMRTVANFELLSQLAEKNGGRFAGVSNYADIVDNINKAETREEAIKHFSFKSVINQIWLCVFILLIIASEWFLRKYFGL